MLSPSSDRELVDEQADEQACEPTYEQAYEHACEQESWTPVTSVGEVCGVTLPL